jgi:hypothetical protein
MVPGVQTIATIAKDCILTYELQRVSIYRCFLRIGRSQVTEFAGLS